MVSKLLFEAWFQTWLKINWPYFDVTFMRQSREIREVRQEDDLMTNCWFHFCQMYHVRQRKTPRKSRLLRGTKSRSRCIQKLPEIWKSFAKKCHLMILAPKSPPLNKSFAPKRPAVNKDRKKRLMISENRPKGAKPPHLVTLPEITSGLLLQACYFFSDCATIDESCSSCVSGERSCQSEPEPGGDGELAQELWDTVAN